MARYIDAEAMFIYFDALIKHAETEGLYNMAHVYERCLRIVKDAPTADVAPRAEVELWKGRTEAVFAAIPETRREFAREIFEKIYEDCFDQFGYINYEALAELKKKYTEN